MRGEGAVAATVVDSGSCPAGRLVGKAKFKKGGNVALPKIDNLFEDRIKVR
jgi:hypothetical protein